MSVLIWMAVVAMNAFTLGSWAGFEFAIKMHERHGCPPRRDDDDHAAP